MNGELTRREFLVSTPAAAWIMTRTVGDATLRPSESSDRMRIEPFDYTGVRLLSSRWQEQYQSARDYYFNVSNDDILKGFREEANLPAPGKTLGGWCERNSATVFGQWLSGMARMYCSTGDSAMREKATTLLLEFAKTVKPDGECGLRHYSYDKLVCGLVDMKKYAGHPDAVPLLERVTGWAERTFNRDNAPAAMPPRGRYQGRPSEWYTLSENLYRAYELTGNPKFKAFAEVWLYPAYWNKFADTSAPTDAHGVHAYSHVNTFSSAAMAYKITGDPMYLRIIKNAYDFLQNTQCYATGGYGPREMIMNPDGGIGRVLDFVSSSFETCCGSWAGFKLSRYLMQFTGEARYGDWIERLLNNGAGAALPITTGGKHTYYSDYRISGGMRVYNWDPYTCCSGTYIQDVVEYHNLIYFKDAEALYVNLYLPSEVIWDRPEGGVKVVQETRYPEDDTTTLTFSLKKRTKFSLKFRVPGWARDVSVKINNIPMDVPCTPGTWAEINRTWNSGDRVDIRIPLRLRMEPVDKYHPHRVAVMRGPVVIVLESDYHESFFRLPERDDDLNEWLVPDETLGVFRVEIPGGGRVASKFLPFYAVKEAYPYKMYFDADKLPIPLIE
ncbi:MAG: beta-L-arabinofuranosidase domain-containing protein [bacterium]